VVVVWLVDNITTEPTWINTIQVTLERSECGISISKATTSGSQLSTWIRYVLFSLSLCMARRRMQDWRAMTKWGRRRMCGIGAN
jgi:hypothetical protein